MKSTIKIETIGKSQGVYVSLGDHVLKTYDTYSRPVWKTIALAEKFAMRWINKYWKDGGIIESYNQDNIKVSHIEI